ncbi:MAG: protein translocase subunit SecD [Planctomycetota bacterium]|nr:protein translocase subunit SecD [Planctomycetota bacterium]
MLETLIQPIFTSQSLMDSMHSLVVGSYGILGQTTTQVAEAAKAAEVAANNWKGFYDVGLFLLAVIVPFVLGKFFSSRLKMPSHAMAFSWILLAIIATGIVLATGQLKLGPDIKGGTNLIYQIDQTTVGNSGYRVMAKDFIAPILNRINPSGMNESVVRPAGDDKLEIIIADVDPAEIEEVKRKITNAGILQFRIVANGNDHDELIKTAKTQAENPSMDLRLSREVKLASKTSGEFETVGLWRTLGRTAEQSGAGEVQGYVFGDTIRNARTGEILNPVLTGRPNDFEAWLDGQKIKDVDVLLSLQKNSVPYVEVNGSDLSRAKVEISKNGGYQVSFVMTTAGAEKMLKMTIANQPDVNTGFKRRMAILLDGIVLSAPSLNSPIRSEGQIEGNFSLKDVEFLVQILNSGSLPGAISKQPISENVVGATMGADAISKGRLASLLGLISTVVCVLAYYRFSGVIATIALVLNLAMILASMMLFRQPLTLAGVAGLVLSVGMSVDANVLVFERIREEKEKNATNRMAIRNGFDRAWTTIFDSNLTTLISALVLYYVGTEQVKGFAITLIIGLAISMFTAVFFAHNLFEIAERWGFAKLGMSDWVNATKRSFFGLADIDFLSYRNMAYLVSGALIAIGLLATVLRGREFLDIDFNGGTSVVFSLEKTMEPDRVREIAQKAFEADERGLPIQTTLTNVEMREFEKNSVFKLDVSLKDEGQVRERLLKGFNGENGAKLVTYDMKSQIVGKSQSGLGVDVPVLGGPAAPSLAPQESTAAKLTFLDTIGSSSARLNSTQIIESLVAASQAAGRNLVDSQVELEPTTDATWTRTSEAGFSEWNVKLPYDEATTSRLLDQMRTAIQAKPVFQSFSKIEGRVAGEMQQKAILGLILSLLFITIYIWFRFNKVSYGVAAVVAVVHDVLITVGLLAISHWLFKPLGFLLIEDFKISLTIVAAILTVIGYSLNDTIVVFDRIREVKGKSPNLTEKMINASVTQTLSRTLLTSSTTIIAILLMYIWGGEGIHGFAFCLLIGIVVGTFSSIFIASPILLWLAQREQAARAASKVTS